MRWSLVIGFVFFATTPAFGQDARFGSSEWGTTSTGGRYAPNDTVPPEASARQAWPLAHALGGGLATLLLFALVGAWWSRDRGVEEEPTPLVDVVLISIALRGAAGERMQTLLPRVARGLGSARARHDALGVVVAALREAKGAWVFGRIVDHLPRAVGPARRDLEQHASELRARYRHACRSEDVRTDDESLVLVSLVVAARGTIEDARTVSVERLDALLRGLLEISSERLVALEITWSPTGARNRLGSAELEVVYPELVRLADPPVARVTCTCGTVSAGELAACPSCGAPHPSVASAPGPLAEEARHEATTSLRETVRAGRDGSSDDPPRNGEASESLATRGRQAGTPSPAPRSGEVPKSLRDVMRAKRDARP
ncbi:MAG: DUF1517 domain-containing protein [Sandaracinus sp.]|nr:DUF1517 domain-containing protein [Sandaracinus sp.]MCB9632411.1 DUF1517 domain-containing protein [Sandaracinus sp.]